MEDPISASFLSGVSSGMERDSVHKAVQNHFFPDAGNFRGVADGSGNSALSTYQVSTTISSSTTNTWTTFAFAPTTNQAGQVFSCCSNPTLYNPFNASGATYYNLSGAFAGTNPSTDYRVVSATIRISPTGAFTSQAAQGKVAYVTDLSRLGTSTTASTIENWSVANIDNTAWSLPVSGVTDIICHWVPNDYETKFRGSGYSKNSAVVGYLYSNNAASSWRVDIKYVLEYYPTTAYVPFVQLQPPDMHPNTYYHINHVCRSMYYPLVIAEYAEWLAMFNKFKSMSGGLRTDGTSYALRTVGLANTAVTDSQSATDWRGRFASWFGGSQNNPKDFLVGFN